MNGDATLEVNGVSKRFGGLTALHQVSFTAREGRITAIIGPNGAGKTTLLNVISGLLPPDSGCVMLGGTVISGLPSHEIARRGITLTVCPLSNTALKVIRRMQDSPVRRMLDAGINVTVNSDDPAYFGGYLNQNFTETFEALPALGAAQAYRLARNSFEASFASAAQKVRWCDALDAHFAAI